MTLIEFLTARYDERANEVAEKHQCSEAANMCGGYNCECGEPFLLAGCTEGRTLLADIAAKRAILAGYEEARNDYNQERDGDGSAKYSDGGAAVYLERLEVWECVLPLLARPFADHPDYNSDWRQA